MLLSGAVLSKLKSRGFRATSLSSDDFFTLYTTLPHNLKKKNFLILLSVALKRSSKMKVHFILHVTTTKPFFTSTDHRGNKLWSCHNVCDVFSYLLGNTCIFDKKETQQ